MADVRRAMPLFCGWLSSSASKSRAVGGALVVGGAPAGVSREAAALAEGGRVHLRVVGRGKGVQS